MSLRRAVSVGARGVRTRAALRCRQQCARWVRPLGPTRTCTRPKTQQHAHARRLSLASSSSSSLVPRRLRTTRISRVSTSQCNSTRRTPRLSTTRRTLFIQTQGTPNPKSLKFLPGKPVLSEHDSASAMDFPTYRSAQVSPLASRLFTIDGVTGVFFGGDFISVSVQDENTWPLLKPEIFGVITDFYSSDDPILRDMSSEDVDPDTVIQDDDDEVVASIKELLETRIRPAVQEDGGDVVFRGFDPETGVVRLQLQGSCVGCPSSSVTLKSGIENMLMYYVEEVEAVEEWVDEELNKVSDEALNKLESKLAAAKGD